MLQSQRNIAKFRGSISILTNYPFFCFISAHMMEMVHQVLIPIHPYKFFALSNLSTETVY